MWVMGGQGWRPPQETHNSYHFCRFLSFCSSLTSNTWRLMTGTFTPTGPTHWDGWWRPPPLSWCHCGPSFRCAGQRGPSERSAWNGGFNYLSVGLNGHILKTPRPLWHLSCWLWKRFCLVCSSVCLGFVAPMKIQSGWRDRRETRERMLHWQLTWHFSIISWCISTISEP